MSPGEAGVGNAVAVGCGEGTVVGVEEASPAEEQAVRRNSIRNRIFLMRVPIHF
jgi:hypothetical protein